MSTTRRPSSVRLTSGSLAIALVALVALTGAQHTKTVYKTVDEDGAVVYSDTPPSSETEARRMAVQTKLSEEEASQAAAYRDRLMRAADFEHKYSAMPAPAGEVREIERKLAAARAKLERDQVVQEDDWAGSQSGRRGLKDSYYARITAAKTEVADLERQLEELR